MRGNNIEHYSGQIATPGKGRSRYLTNKQLVETKQLAVCIILFLLCQNSASLAICEKNLSSFKSP